MANNYLQFSQILDEVPSTALPWIEEVLAFNPDEANEKEFETLRTHLLDKDRSLDLEFFPGFDVDIETTENGANQLWFHSEENSDLVLLSAFVYALIRKFMPEAEFTLSAAAYCSKLRIDEFGGIYLVVNSDGITQGSTWDSIHELTEKADA